MVNRKEWLDYVYYKLGNQFDFLVCGLTRLPNGEIKATKWRKYSEVCFGLNPWEYMKIEWINQRQILPNELVLDIEEKESYNEVIKKVKEYGFDKWYAYDTGSRGTHIHLFSSTNITEKQKEFFCNEFNSDKAKIKEKTMIALENCPHWKTGKIKTLMEKQE
jgi:hypothetical protein